MRRPETYRVYTSIIEKHIAKSSIAHVPLQQLRSADLERYLADQTKAAATTLKVHHAILHKALKRAVKDHVVTMNAAAGNEYRAVAKDHAQAMARAACWSATEARHFIETAKKESPQLAAFLFLALDTGARKSELAGLWWTDLNLDTSTVTIARQLDKAGETPEYGPTKTGKSRTVTLGSETIAQLRLHKKTQAALKMKHRTTYADFGLIFAKEEEHTHGPHAALGQPIKTLSEERFQRVVTLAGLPAIKFHSTRHTSITLALNAGVPVHVVAQRVGHAKATMTLDVYAHALPDAQQEAAAKLRAILHG